MGKATALEGFFANIVTGVDLTPDQANELYRLRDSHEKYHEMLKDQLDEDRVRSWMEATRDGRLFTVFVASIIASALKRKHLSDEYLKSTYSSWREMLMEMNGIRILECTDGEKIIDPFVGKSVKVCEHLGYIIPKDCAPAYYRRKRNGVEPPRIKMTQK